MTTVAVSLGLRAQRIRRLRARDPQLLQIFEKLDSDHRAGRLWAQARSPS